MAFCCFKQMFQGRYTSVIDEAICLSESCDADEVRAGVAFLNAILIMSIHEKVFGKTVPPHLFSPLLQRGEAMFVWTQANHSLYTTYIRRKPEIRALMACNGVDPENVRAIKAALRHNAM